MSFVAGILFGRMMRFFGFFFPLVFLGNILVRSLRLLYQNESEMGGRQVGEGGIFFRDEIGF